MSQRSFNESFLERLEKLCQKYEDIEDKSDDTIDLLKMEVVSDKGKTKKMSKIDVGTLYNGSYKRTTDIIKEKDNLIGRVEFDEIYEMVFSYEFESLYKYCIDDKKNGK